jgi:hypothetical protein
MSEAEIVLFARGNAVCDYILQHKLHEVAMISGSTNVMRDAACSVSKAEFRRIILDNPMPANAREMIEREPSLMRNGKLATFIITEGKPNNTLHRWIFFCFKPGRLI